MNKKNERNVFLLTSILLQYPDSNWYDNLEEIISEAEKVKEEACIEPILKFLEYAKKTKDLDLSELYVNTFDFEKKTNLYLTYYRFKEQKERGAALLNLKRKYAKAGFKLISSELPDFLPVILEFSSASETKDILKDYIDVIQNIFNSLSRDNNPYSYVIKAVLMLLETENEDMEDSYKSSRQLGCI